MIAAAILAAGIVMAMAIMGSARAQLLRAEQRWGRTHVMAQACEFYLLAGPDEAMPRGLLPQGFSADCELREADELPEGLARVTDPVSGWRLGLFTVTVYNSWGDRLGTWEIHKPVRFGDVF